MRLFIAVVLCALAGCDKPPPPVAPGMLPPLAAPPEERVVAMVNGQPITIDQVAEQARAAGSTVQEALQALIRAELLAREAEHRGVITDPAVQRVAKQEMVRRYLTETFEKTVTPQNAISEEWLHRVYESNRSRLVHGEVRHVHQILIQSPENKADAGLALAQEVERAARTAKTLAEFDQIPDKLSAKPQSGVSAQLQIGSTSRVGMTVEEFAKATFDLKQEGDVSPVVKSRFGYHVIRYVSTTPAENIGYDQAKEKLREGLWPDAQTRAFARTQESLAKDHRVTTYPERLAALQEAE